MAEFIESLHPRDELGRWAFKGGTGGWLVDKEDRAEISGFKDQNPARNFTNEAVRSFRERNPLPESPNFNGVTVLDNYVGTGKSYALNKVLRLKQPLTDEQQKTAAGLDDLMSRASLSEDTMLYRYLNRHAAGRFGDDLLKMSPGDSFTDPAFISTSFRPPYPVPNNKLLIMKILAPEGSRALVAPEEVDRFHEQEVILDRNSCFEYVGEDDDGSRVFRLRQDSKEALHLTDAARTTLDIRPGQPMPSQAGYVTTARAKGGSYFSGVSGMTYRDVEVLVNPTTKDVQALAKEDTTQSSLLKNLHSVRAIKDDVGNIVVWKADAALHSEVLNAVFTTDYYGDKSFSQWYLRKGSLVNNEFESSKPIEAEDPTTWIASGQANAKKAEPQSLDLRSKGTATTKLQEYSSTGEQALLTDVTGFESEGIIGFLTPDGRAYNTQDEHARVAKEAGTSLDALLEEGTFRVYANGSDTLGIEAHVAPTKQQVAELIKMARAGSYDRFVIDTQGAVPADFQKFEGHVTPKAVRDTIDRTFATLHLTSSFKADADVSQVKKPALHAFDPGQNAFLQVANDTKTSLDVYKDGYFWKQAGPQEEIEQQASRAVVELGGTEREMLAVVGIGDNERRVAFQAGEEGSVSPSYDIYAMLGQDRTATYKAIHNHPLPYTLSNGDIGWLNSMVQVKTIREDDMDGGWSEASIPGREKGEYVKWPDLGMQLIDYNDRVGSDASYRASGPIARVRRRAGSSKEAVDGRTFLQQHAEMLGLHAAGIINYSYKLSSWQQGWIDKYTKEFNETVQIATDHAMKLKDFLHKKETWVANKNELYPK